MEITVKQNDWFETAILETILNISSLMSGRNQYHTAVSSKRYSMQKLFKQALVTAIFGSDKFWILQSDYKYFNSVSSFYQNF